METKQWIRGIIVLSIKTPPPPNSLTVWEDSLFLLLFLDFSLARQAHPGIAVNAARHKNLTLSDTFWWILDWGILFDFVFHGKYSVSLSMNFVDDNVLL